MFTIGRKKYKSVEDAALIQLFKTASGKHDALLAEIYMRYGHLVMGTAMKYLKNKMDAEDITMTLFEKLPGKLEKHNITHLKSWLYMVTKNECLMKLRKKNMPTSEIDERVQPYEETFDEQKEVQLNALEAAIDDLKEEQKQCIELFYLQSKSYQEIATSLNLDIKKVKSAIQNGKRNLKLRLINNEKESDT